MKKIIWITILLVICFNSVFAQEQKQESSSRKVVSLIEDNLFKNENNIYELSQDLNQTQKNAIFDVHEKNWGGSFALNLILGAGIGSYVQGDIKGGLIGTAGEVITFFAFKRFMAEYDSYGYISFYDEDYEEQTASRDKYAIGASISAIFLFATRIYECIRPATYAKNYNKKLASSLGLYDLNVSISPQLKTNSDANLALAVTFKL